MKLICSVPVLHPCPQSLLQQTLFGDSAMMLCADCVSLRSALPMRNLAFFSRPPTHHPSFPSDGKTAFMNYYPPQNKDFVYPEGVKPPLLVRRSRTARW